MSPTPCPKLILIQANDISNGECSSAEFPDFGENIFTDFAILNEDNLVTTSFTTTQSCTDANSVSVNCPDNSTVICAVTYTDTWEATKGDACSETVEQTRVYKDTTAPVIDATTVPDAGCECGSDNCKKLSDYEHDVKCESSGGCYGKDDPFKPTVANDNTIIQDTCTIDDNVREIRKLTWTVEDDCGNGSTRVQTITTIDTKPPVIDLKGLETEQFFQATTLTTSLPLEGFGDLVSTHDKCDQLYNKATTVTFCDKIEDLEDGTGVKVVRTFNSKDACGNKANKEDLEVTIANSCNFIVSKAFSGVDFEVNIQVTEVAGDGGVHPHNYLKFEVTNEDDRAGDLRGVFFDISSLSDSVDLGHSKLIVTEMHDQDWLSDPNPEDHDIPIPEKYDTKCVNGDPILDRLNNDVLMRGGGKKFTRQYSCAVEIGERGIRHEDDVSHAVFTVSHPHTPITVADLTGNVGVRLTSVEDGGGRELSSKINGTPECASNTAEDMDNQYPCGTPEPHVIPHVPSDSTSSTVPATSTTSSTSTVPATSTTSSTTGGPNCDKIKDDIEHAFGEGIFLTLETCQATHPTIFD